MSSRLGGDAVGVSGAQALHSRVARRCAWRAWAANGDVLRRAQAGARSGSVVFGLQQLSSPQASRRWREDLTARRREPSLPELHRAHPPASLAHASR